MTKRVTLGMIAVLALFLPVTAGAQLQMGGGFEEACGKIESLRKAGNITAARDAANECADGLDKLVEGEIAAHILERVGDWKRTRFEQTQMAGMSSANFEYTKGGTRVRGTLLGGGSGRGLGNAFSAFARMGAAAGGGRELKVADVPARIMPNGQFMINFEDGTTLTFESSQHQTPDAALEAFGDLIDQFPVAKIRDALAGR